MIIALADNIINIDDIRMHQPSSRFSLALELLEQLVIAEELVAQHFDSHIAVQHLVMGQKNLRHAAIAHRTDDFVASIQYGFFLLIHLRLPPPH